MKLNPKLIEDTGWIDMSSYINTTYFSVRSGFAPYVRIRDGIVYWKGEVLCHTAPTTTVVEMFINIPTTYLPSGTTSGGNQINGCGVRFDTGDTYAIYISNNSKIQISGPNVKKTTTGWQGYQLSNIPPYPKG